MSDFVHKEFEQFLAKHKFDGFIEYMMNVHEKQITYDERGS